MDNADRMAELTLGVLQNGLSYLGSSIAEKHGCSLCVSSAGQVLYEKDCSEQDNRDNFGKLTYMVETNEGSIKLVLRGLPPDRLELGMNCLKEAEFAVQCFFSKVNMQKQRDSVINKGVVRYTFNEHLTRSNFIDIVSTYCNPDYKYYVSILNDCTKEEQRFMARNLKRSQTFNISIMDDRNLILIIQHMYNPLTNTIDENSPSEEQSQEIFQRLLSEYNGCPKFANGCSGTPGELFLSYQQAMFTMSFMKLTGHSAFSTRYSELGLGIPLSSNNWVAMKEYCIRSLAPILEADKINNCSYFESLTTYLDLNCNGKEAADHLFIHVNTLYYRLKKIETLLGVSTTDMCDITHLYYVTKIYKALIESGILEDEIS